MVVQYRTVLVQDTNDDDNPLMLNVDYQSVVIEFRVYMEVPSIFEKDQYKVVLFSEMHDVESDYREVLMHDVIVIRVTVYTAVLYSHVVFEIDYCPMLHHI